MPAFSLAQRVSEPQLGYTENDDCAAFVRTSDAVLAWVIDGATSVAAQRHLGAESGDVSWFANALSAALQAHAARDLSLKALHALAAADVTRQYESRLGARLAAVPLHARPSASLVMVRLDAGGGQLYYLGDCPGYALSDSGRVVRLTDRQRTDGEADLRERVARTQATKSLNPREMFAEHVPWLQAQREIQLHMRPLDVSAALSGAHFGGWERRVDLTDVRALVLMSDGYERYSAQYGLGDETALIAATVEKGAAEVLQRLRRFEAQDAHARALPRLKVSDDATCLVLTRD